jgi:membrane protein DedA with SNARE-associated domain
LLGYFAGKSLNSIERYSGWAGGIILVLIIAVVVGLYFAKKRGEKLLEARLREEDPHDDSAQGAE